MKIILNQNTFGWYAVSVLLPGCKSLVVRGNGVCIIGGKIK